MLPRINGATEQFLVGLDRIQSTLNNVQRQISSGVRVGQASDDPAAVPSILASQAQIAANTQSVTNLDQVKTELQSGDAALQQAVQVVEQAITLASQAATSTSSAARGTLIGQVQDIQQQLVAITRTAVAGRFIFSGDLDQQPLYTLDAGGVRQLANPTSTRAITDAGGNTLWVPPTAQEIFDPRNPDTTPATGNVFAAVTSLLTALQNGNTGAAGAAADSLKSADDYLNQQLGLYGIAENRVAAASSAAASAIVTEKQNLSGMRDADLAGDAIQMSQATLEQQAALSSRAKMSQLSLFNFLA